MKIDELYIYPVKSCAGIRVPELRVDAWGPVNDRRWMIVDENAQFLTQRTHPQMATIGTFLHADHLRLTVDGSDFELADDPAKRARLEVTVWKSKVLAEVVDQPALTLTLSRYLGQSVRLVEFGPEARRDVTMKDVPTGHSVRFADGFPFLLANVASLNDLNGVLTKAGHPTVPMNRFRANIIVSGLEPYAEDELVDFRSRELRLRNLKPCARCPIITVDQATGVKTGHEPLATLARVRNFERKVLFGVNVVSEGVGFLREGEVLNLG